MGKDGSTVTIASESVAAIVFLKSFFSREVLFSSSKTIYSLTLPSDYKQEIRNATELPFYIRFNFIIILK